MTEDLQSSWMCQRCGRGEARPLAFAPWPGELGRRIQSAICEGCWDEWVNMQTRIINEYRLNVLDPGHAKALRQQMEVFLGFRKPEEEGPGE